MNDEKRRKRVREIVDNEVNNPEYYNKFPKPKSKKGWKFWRKE